MSMHPNPRSTPCVMSSPLSQIHSNPALPATHSVPSLLVATAALLAATPSPLGTPRKMLAQHEGSLYCPGCPNALVGPPTGLLAACTRPSAPSRRCRCTTIERRAAWRPAPLSCALVTPGPRLAAHLQHRSTPATCSLCRPSFRIIEARSNPAVCFKLFDPFCSPSPFSCWLPVPPHAAPPPRS